MPLGQAWFRINCEAVNPTSSLIVIEIQAMAVRDRGDALPPWRVLEGSRPPDPCTCRLSVFRYSITGMSVLLCGVSNVNDAFRRPPQH
jgi:hypothetical protein